MIAAKDVDSGQVVQAIATIQAEGYWANRRDLEAFFPGVPERVLLAKLRRLLRAGEIDGCGCGCRGDFTVTPDPQL